ncbi:WxL domain-containing protein [Lactiplantibacillus dongliensis]|uniref:WxL domain-containing protein n=1 Tax=Lactiplantibacillus dongliensis TaxID=2559919 RepID=A0ABW1R8C7_9LACO|nr:WxL domain-containing protein [Lactiplantibacillus dongliensis]
MPKLSKPAWWLLVLSCAGFSGGWLPLNGRAAVQQSHAEVEITPGNGDDAVKPVDPNDPSKPYPGDPVDPGNPGTGSKGHLTIDFISNLKFEVESGERGPVTTTAKNQLAMVQISDRRATGAGWTLQVRPSVPTSRQYSLQTTIDLGAVKIKPVTANVSAAPQLVNRVLRAGLVNNVLVANRQAGVGTWLLVLNQTNAPTQLVIHNQMLHAGNYVGTMTWSLTNAPS